MIKDLKRCSQKQLCRVNARLTVWLDQDYAVMRELIRAFRHKQSNHLFERTGGKIQHGLFSGLELTRRQSWGTDFTSMLLGAYEVEVTEHLQQLDLNSYDFIVNVGCANGFYTAGLAKCCPTARLFAYHIRPLACQITETVLIENSLTERVEIAERCTPAMLQKHCERAKRLLIIVIEGDELNLVDPKQITKLYRADLIIACHDRGHDNIVRELENRLTGSHHVSYLPRRCRFAGNYPELARWPDLDSALILNEMRVRTSCWLWATANSPIL